MSVKFPSGGMNDRTCSDSQRLNRTHGWKLTSSRSRGFCHQQREVLKKQSKALTVRHKRLRGRYPTIKDIVRSGIPLSFTQASITPWISADTVVPGKGGVINLTYETLHEEKGLQNIQQYNMCWSNKCQFVPDLSTMASISSVTSKYASLLVYLTPARLHGMFDSWPCGNVSPTLLPPEKETKPRWSHKCTH